MIKKLFFLLFPIVISAQNLNDLKKAAFFSVKSVNDSAVFYFEKGLKDCINCKTIEIANYYLQYAESQKNKGNTESAILSILKAEKIFLDLQNYEGIVKSKISKGEFYRHLGEGLKALTFLDEAQVYIDKYLISKQTLAIYYNRRAAISQKDTNNGYKLIELHKKSLQISEEINDYQLQFSSLNEIAFVYEYLDFSLAKEYYLKALKIARKQQFEFEICDVLSNLGRFELKTAIRNKEKGILYIDEFNQSIAYSHEGLQLAKKLKYFIKYRDILNNILSSYKFIGNYKEALKYSEEFTKFEMVVLNQKKEKEIIEIEGKFINEIKDAQIKEKEAEIKRQYGGFLLLGISILILFYFIKKLKKDKINIQKQKNRVEEIVMQKTALLKEIHHRVKNNLQVISGLLYLQANKYNSPEIEKMVNDSQKHINSIALVHEMLYSNNNLAFISMQKYLTELTNRVLQVSSYKNIDFLIAAKNISLAIDYATPLGLILNELLSNSVKYAFKNGKGEITISLLHVSNNKYQFIYTDNGVGMDVNAKPKNSKSLGLKLIKMFAEEMDADLKTESNNGLSYTLTFTSKQS